jgi:hypothetical protein
MNVPGLRSVSDTRMESPGECLELETDPIRVFRLLPRKRFDCVGCVGEVSEFGLVAGDRHRCSTSPVSGIGCLAIAVEDRQEISLFTPISIIGGVHDLTLAELRLETFWPMDQTSAVRWERLQERLG